MTHGTLSLGQKIVHSIGDPVSVKIVDVNQEEKRVEGEIRRI